MEILESTMVNIELKDGTILKNIRIALNTGLMMNPIDNKDHIKEILKGIIPKDCRGVIFGDFIEYSSGNKYGAFKYTDIESYDFV